jgi:tungstate transport system substrate-binding protein
MSPLVFIQKVTKPEASVRAEVTPSNALRKIKNAFLGSAMLVVVGAAMLSQRKPILALIAVFCGAVFLTGHALAQEKSIVVASTTSTKDSGLFEHLLPLFTLKTGIAVKVLAVGTGQALDIARRGDADVVFVHAKSAEQTFVAEGYGVKRHPVMYNEFVLIGPESDPAGIKGMKDVAKALKAIKDKPATFISRGDNSGTHMFELMLWNKDVGINIQELGGPWYKSIARGMKATLHIAVATDGYALSDRSTWISFKNKGDLKILVEGDRRVLNQYSVILVNPNKHPNVQKELGQTFIDWLISPEGQRGIADYKINGEQLFFPNATDPNA